MKDLKKMTLTALLAVGLLAGASLSAQAAESLISSKDTVLKTVVATPAKAKVSGQPVDTASYNSKAVRSGGLTSAKAKVSGQPIDAAAYSSKGR